MYMKKNKIYKNRVKEFIFILCNKIKWKYTFKIPWLFNYLNNFKVFIMKHINIVFTLENN